MQTGIYSHLNCHIKHRKKKYLIINVCLEIHHQEREAQWWMPMQLQMPMIPEATAQPLPGEEYTTFHWQPLMQEHTTKTHLFERMIVIKHR